MYFESGGSKVRRMENSVGHNTIILLNFIYLSDRVGAEFGVGAEQSMVGIIFAIGIDCMHG